MYRDSCSFEPAPAAGDAPWPGQSLASLTRDEREAINGGAWFGTLSPTLRHDILRAARVTRHRDGDLLAGAGQPASDWLACARGAVRIASVTAAGRCLTLDYAEPGRWLEAAGLLLDGDAPAHDLHACGATTLLRVARPAFRTLLGAHVELRDALLRHQAESARHLIERLDDLKTLDLQARLVKLLLELARKHGVAVSGGVRITLRLAQRELAEWLGASRQRINVQLKDLERRSAIAVDAGALVLRDLGALQRLGEPAE